MQQREQRRDDADGRLRVRSRRARCDRAAARSARDTARRFRRRGAGACRRRHARSNSKTSDASPPTISSAPRAADRRGVAGRQLSRSPSATAPRATCSHAWRAGRSVVNARAGRRPAARRTAPRPGARSPSRRARRATRPAAACPCARPRRTPSARSRACRPACAGTIQICRKWTSSSGDALNSLCVTPVPADMRCTSPGRITEPVPMLSLCCSAPSSTYEMISMSRCPCCPKPLPGRDAILVDHAQRAEAHVLGVVVVRERERVKRAQPAVVGVAALPGATDRDIGGVHAANVKHTDRVERSAALPRGAHRGGVWGPSPASFHLYWQTNFRSST